MFHRYLTFILLLWIPIVSATSMVGKIEDLTCPSDYYILTRQGELSPLPVNIFTELQAGDMLLLKEGKLSAKEIPVNDIPCKEKLFSITQNTAHINPQAPILTLTPLHELKINSINCIMKYATEKIFDNE